MSKEKKNRKKGLRSIFEIPPEAAGATRVILIDNSDLFLENHQGVREYTMSSVRIRTGRFEIVVRGSGLVLKNMGKENIVLSGEIAAIEFV